MTRGVNIKCSSELSVCCDVVFVRSYNTDAQEGAHFLILFYAERAQQAVQHSLVSPLVFKMHQLILVETEKIHHAEPHSTIHDLSSLKQL